MGPGAERPGIALKAAPIVVAILAVTAVAFAAGSGFMDVGTLLLVLAIGAVAVPLSSRMASDRDPWIWWVGPAAFVAKLAGAAARYSVLFVAYEGSGDVVRYHNNGLVLAETWRSFSIPPLGGGTGAGTQFVDVFTGLVYSLQSPTMLGGFFIFATFGFIGQLLLYASFRRGVPDGRLPAYAGLVLFLPALVFWPSSIGKESLMLLFLGVATYGLTRSFAGYGIGWLLLAALGLAGAGIIRPHVSALLAGAFAIAAVLGRGQWSGAIAVRRTLIILASVALLGVGVGAVGERFAIAGPEDVDPFVSEIERRTQQGGSAVEGGPVASPAELPAATLRVLFRPLPNEAHNIQSLASAAENVALLGLILWRLPSMIRYAGRVRNPFVLMCLVFSVGFVIAFSSIFNLGILTRQRAQVLPFLLAVVVAVGWAPQMSPETEVARLGLRSA